MARPEGKTLPEIVHLPGSTLVPMVTALGLAIALVGLIVSWVIVAIGAVILIAAVLRWINDVRREVGELPD